MESFSDNDCKRNVELYEFQLIIRVPPGSTYTHSSLRCLHGCIQVKTQKD
jgi:hypothetical protein